MSKNTKSKNTKTKKKSRSSLSAGFSAVTILLLVLFIAMVTFVACDDKDESSKDQSEAISQSKSDEISKSTSETASKEDSNDKSSKEESSEDDKNSSKDNSESDKSEATSEEEPSSDDVVVVPGGGEKYSHIAWFKAENGRRYDAYGEKNPNYSLEQVVTYVNIGLDSPYFTNTYPAKKEDGNFILVNKYSYVDKNYTPDNLVELDSSCKISGKSVKLVKEAADAFKELHDAAKALEYNIIGMSGYRSYAYQENLYNKYLKTDTQEKVDTYSARPGYSEHHTGLALDVQTDTVSFSNFGQTKEYEWLLDNAHLYGFVIHYTAENQWITGYMPEEWHIRYLGVEAATYIYDYNLSVDEYLVMYGATGPQAAG